MNFLLQSIYWHFFDQNLQLVFLLFDFLLSGHQLDRFCALFSTKQFFLLPFFPLKLFNCLLESLIVFYWEEVVTLVENASRCVDLSGAYTLFAEVTQDRLTVRVLELNHVVI